jgi:hypothetical protein
MEDKLKQEIVLGENCAIELNATFKMLRICVSIYLVWVLFSLYKQILELFNGAGGAYIQSNFILKYKIIPIAYLLQSIVILIGIYYQFKSFKMQRDALYLSDSTSFVKSYTFFRKGLMASLIATLITILIYVAFKFFGFTSKF